jgi:phosphatidate cytidylyltransferase
MSADLARRTAVAAVGIPAAAAFVWLGGWFLAILLALFAVAGAREFYRFAERGGVHPIGVPGYAGAALAPLAAFAVLPDGGGLPVWWVGAGAVIWFIVVGGTTMALRAPVDRPLAAAAITVFGAVYTGVLPASLIILRHPAPGVAASTGTALVFLPLVLTWVGDTAAMGGGYLIGGPKLAPVLSPKKTWAGAVAGATSAVVLAPLYGRVVLERVGVDVRLWQLALFGLVVSIVGQAGDVGESLYKREVGMKDSGGFFPGHGGVLDRFDSLYWALPTAVILLRLFGVL